MRAGAVLIDKIFRKGFAVILHLLLCLFFYCAASSPLFAEDSGDASSGEWLTIESSYFTVYYRPNANLKKIEKKLRRRFYTDGSFKVDAFSSSAEKLADRLDILFNRVKKLLEMYPRTKDVKMKIFKDRKELDDEYYRIFRKKDGFISFYIHKYKTIYTTERDISDSVIAHEMGHVITDHYFVVKLPAKIGELMATYVDLHLDD